MKRYRCVLWMVVWAVGLTVAAWGQDELPTAITVQNRGGDLPFSSSVGSSFEHVDVASGGLVVDLSIAHVPGRGPAFDFGLHYDARSMVVAARGTFNIWNLEQRNYAVANGFGWETSQPYVTYFDTSYLGTPKCPTGQPRNLGGGPSPTPGTITPVTAGSYIYSEGNGSKHALLINSEYTACPGYEYTVINSQGPDDGGAGLWASAGSGIAVLHGPPAVYFADGSVNGPNTTCTYSRLDGFFCPYGGLADVHGNQTTNLPGGTDTIGRVNLTQSSGSNQVIYTVYDAGGTARNYTVNYQAFAIQTSFGVNDLANHPITEYAQTRNAITSIVFPDGSTYGFQYDSFGELISVALPTGGVINYTWATQAASNSTIRYVSSRSYTVNGVTSQWQFLRGFNASGQQQVTVTDPQGNQTVHTLSGPAIIQTQVYGGSAGNGTLLRQYDIVYTDATVAVDQLPARITTTLENGLVSRKEFDYDQFTVVQQACFDPSQCGQNGTTTNGVTQSRGNVVAVREYDWGSGAPGALLRTTANHYLHDPADNPATAGQYSALNIVSRIIRQTITDSGGTTASDTQYEYDNNGAGGTYRGDATAVKRWRNTDNAWLTTAYAYNAFGGISSITDPLGHVTSWDYSDRWASSGGNCLPSGNSSAYPTLRTNALGHRIQFTHSPCTGQVTQHQDENDLRASGPGSTRTYDLMDRPFTVTDALGGQTSFLYPDANTVTQAKKITATLTDSSTSIADALGRAVQTLHVTPSGTAKVDTTYNGLGQVASVTNPYFATSDPTYGSTQSQYDVLGRVTQVTKQDGSISTLSYSGNCTTATDEAGKQHNSCADALGRLISVTEPGDTYAGAAATGSLTITGTLESFVSGAQAAHTASGSVSISGGDQQKGGVVCDADGFCQDNTIYDSGTVSITVNGHTNTYVYQQDSGYSIAMGLAQIINGDAGAPVTATAAMTSTGGVVNLTSKLASAAANSYTLASSTTYDSGDFRFPSFSTSNSGGTLTGGVTFAAGTTNWDSGTVSLTVGGYTATASYSQSGNSTAAQVAQALVSPASGGLNNAGSPVSANANGATITLTWKTNSAAGNAAVAASATHAAGFSSASFGSAGTTLAGGADPIGATLNHPYITLYNYDVLGNLLCVEQHGNVAGTGCGAPATSDATSPWRVRRFTYNSLSQLLTAHNPESGTISYQYDNNGNVTAKTDARGVTESSSYDALNRVTAVSWSDGTRGASYTYDQTGVWGANETNTVGRLVLAYDGNHVATLFSYDALGRVTTQWDCLPSSWVNGVNQGCDQINAQYDLAGNLAQLTYPNGEVVNYSVNSAGEVTAAVDSANGINFVKQATYGPGGALTGFVSGQSSSFAGITSAFSFNNRLQPLNISAASPTATVFSLNYDFHNGNGNNGNVWGITNNKDITRNQSFTYDALNRLTSAQNAGTDCSKATLNGKTEYWGNSYTYDAWGNLLSKNVTRCGAENFSVAALVNNRLSGYGYDAAGNMTNDNLGNGFTYDGASRIAQVNGSAVTYTYGPATGERVRKDVNGQPSTQYYYFGDQILAERNVTSNAWTSYVFFNGSRVARRDSGGVSYYFSDQLKTASVMTDASGNIKSESDYYPWGGELQFANGDSNHYKFTGKERDSETGLDYFGARYYSNGFGRFITPDWAAKATAVPYADFADPQSLNLYTYVRNIPTTKLDADGHDAGVVAATLDLFTGGVNVAGPAWAGGSVLLPGFLGGGIAYSGINSIANNYNTIARAQLQQVTVSNKLVAAQQASLSKDAQAGALIKDGKDANTAATATIEAAIAGLAAGKYKDATDVQEHIDKLNEGIKDVQRAINGVKDAVGQKARDAAKEVLKKATKEVKGHDKDLQQKPKIKTDKEQS